MLLLLESLSIFSSDWAEYLGNLARYGQGSDASHKGQWFDAAHTWYHLAAHQSPEVGRLQHHLGMLAEPGDLRPL